MNRVYYLSEVYVNCVAQKREERVRAQTEHISEVEMMKHYVAYVASYTLEDKYGIRVYDVDLLNGRLVEKEKVKISNSSYLTISKNLKFLYSITDSGVNSFAIAPNGMLTLLNKRSINGMRGCYLSTDYTNSYLFVAGYHDGKLTVLRLLEDGSIGEITDEVYHKGQSSLADKNIRPHITCARVTRDNHYLLVSDQGMDHVAVYQFDETNGKVRRIDIIRCALNADPKHIRVSQDGRFVYILNEQKCDVDVYSYREENSLPVFDKIQNIPTLETKEDHNSLACTLKFSADYRYMLSSNTSDNSVVVYEVSAENGCLHKQFILPVSGDYPKDVSLFPNNEFLVSLNHESNSMTFFRVNFERDFMIQNGSPIAIPHPNCIIFNEVS
ncbi:MAG: lactonase family protein [Clostridium sp.]|nr:lactonase family protein [Clostridium sp.]